jgi:hypothetical protein
MKYKIEIWIEVSGDQAKVYDFSYGKIKEKDKFV